MTNETEPAPADSLKRVADLLDMDPEYAKTLGINAQGIAYLHGAAEALAKPTSE